MEKIKTHNWMLKIWNKFSTMVYSDNNKETKRKISNVIWAILIGSVISAIIILSLANDPGNIFNKMFSASFGSMSYILIPSIVVYAIAALGVSFATKAGLFNVGISGQMMLSGFVTLVLFKAIHPDNPDGSHAVVEGWSIFIAFFLSIISASLLSGLAGVLKAYFKINEVVSTIFLNFIIFFLIAYFVGANSFLQSNDLTMITIESASYTMPSFFTNFNSDLGNVSLPWYTNGWFWVMISITTVLVLGSWFIYKKTVFGYKLKMLKANKNASKYAGVEDKKMTILVMLISGAFAGISGFIFYTTARNGSILISSSGDIITQGFDALALSLLVYNNPFAIILSSFGYSVLVTGGEVLTLSSDGLSKDSFQIIIGIFIYFAAISVTFSKLNVYSWTKNSIELLKHKDYRNYLLIRIKMFFKNKNEALKIEANILKRNVSKIKKWRTIKQDYKHQINNLKEELTINGKKFVLDILDDEQKNYYFNSLSEFKKEMNIKLDKQDYFLKNYERAEQKIKYNAFLNKYNIFKNYLLTEEQQYKKMLYEYRKMIIFKYSINDSIQLIEKLLKQVDTHNQNNKISDDKNSRRNTALFMNRLNSIKRKLVQKEKEFIDLSNSEGNYGNI